MELHVVFVFKLKNVLFNSPLSPRWKLNSGLISKIIQNPSFRKGFGSKTDDLLIVHTSKRTIRYRNRRQRVLAKGSIGIYRGNGQSILLYCDHRYNLPPKKLFRAYKLKYNYVISSLNNILFEYLGNNMLLLILKLRKTCCITSDVHLFSVV